VRQTKLASSLVNFRVHYKIVWLYFNVPLSDFLYVGQDWRPTFF